VNQTALMNGKQVLYLYHRNLTPSSIHHCSLRTEKLEAQDNQSSSYNQKTSSFVETSLEKKLKSDFRQ